MAHSYSLEIGACKVGGMEHFNMNESNDMNKLSKNASELLEQIKAEKNGDFVQYYWDEKGWPELVQANLVNVWTDDLGYMFVEYGPQQ